MCADNLVPIQMSSAFIHRCQRNRAYVTSLLLPTPVSFIATSTLAVGEIFSNVDVLSVYFSRAFVLS